MTMADPKTLLTKLADTLQQTANINPIGGIPNDLTAANFTPKTQASTGQGQPATAPGTIPPASKPG